MQTRLVRCCSIHRGHCLQLQLSCNYPYRSFLQHTTPQLPFPPFISAHTKCTSHLLSHLHYVQLIIANLHTTGLLLLPLNKCIQRSRKQLFCAPTSPTLAAGPCPKEEKSTGHADATSLLPHTPATSSCACTYLSPRAWHQNREINFLGDQTSLTGQTFHHRDAGCQSNQTCGESPGQVGKACSQLRAGGSSQGFCHIPHKQEAARATSRSSSSNLV